MLRKIILIVIIISTTILWSININAFGRVGGGESFSSGGDEGFGGGSGGVDIPVYAVFQAFRMLIYLNSHNPKIGIPFTIFFILIILNFGRNINHRWKSLTLSTKVKTSIISQSTESKEKAIESIKGRDPAFDINILLKRVENGFLKLQEAWSNQDLRPIRPFVSDAVYTRFSTQIAQQKEEGWRNVMENVRIKNSIVASAQSDKWFDTIHIRFEAEASDYRISLIDRKIINGTKKVAPFVEYWSFLRRPGVHTSQSPGLWEGNCPRCGAQLKISAMSRCEFCQSIINSGEYDWVLAEITQESVWIAKESKNISGAEEAFASDPFFTPQVLEDIASTIFWKDIYARQKGTIVPLRKLIHPNLAETMEKSWSGLEGRVVYNDPALGSSELELVERDGDWFKAYIRIAFSAIKYAVGSNGEKIPLAGGLNLPEVAIFVLVKKISAKSKKFTGLASLSCPNCGGPQSSTDNDTCEYCNSILNAGENQWVLKEVLSPLELLEKKRKITTTEKVITLETENQQSEIANEISRLVGPQSLLAGLVFVAGADGKIDPEERGFLLEWARKLKVPEEKVTSWIKDAPNLKNTPRVTMPSNPQEAALWARALIQTGLSDGEISNKERWALRQFCGRLNIDVLDLDRLIENEKRALLSRSLK